MKKLRVTVDGTVFEVTVEIADAADQGPAGAPAPAPAAAPLPTPPPPPPAPTPAPAAKAPAQGPGDARSPLAGKIVSIDVQVGQTVAEGAQVATIEAMKMNTYVNAPKAGRVATINAKPGDAVEEGATLLVIE
jgi:biotin carboxyl carrier protein